MRLALFGGTFDPIHKAHLRIAREAADRFHLDRVLLIPAARPPHKCGVTHAPYEDRVRMAELACAGEPRFQVSRLEEGTIRSYSINTIAKVRAQLAPDQSQAEIFFIIGGDAFGEIRTWYRWEDVVRSVRFIVVSRPGHDYHAPPGIAFDRLDGLDLAVSSSAVRRALARGGDPPELPQPVFHYIREHGLYAG